MITYVKHVSIPVNDPQQSLTFYTEKLGFRVLVDEGHWIELEIPGGETRIVLQTPSGQDDQIGTFSPIIFTSDDVQKTYQELKERGVEFTQELTVEPWGTIAIFEDPDENRFCLSST